MRWAIVLLSTLFALFGTAPASAHEKYHYEGRISGIQDGRLYVDIAVGTTVILSFGVRTTVFHDEERVDASELHSGYGVSVDALGHSPSDLEATCVRFE